ncbi:hypothetical protein [Acidianus manzaensis]|uniref:Uncharacterized protein n=1 Tax=Acidianus manzaensis TaxID=282676 RepID=A0A1W6JXL7_9CREN|nr:hypothetical protein [Acidianus manzaensis]ARM74954.1 hypothetical protein B6F84_02195 [Acidianus manzaensis]
MNLVDILLMLQKEKNSLDWAQLKEEYSRQGKLIDELSQAKLRLKKIKDELQNCSNEFTSKYVTTISDALKKIDETDDPYSIINIINEQYIQVEKCKKELSDIINEKIKKYKEIIEANNEKLKLYSRIYITILGKSDIQIQSFQICNDISKLEKTAKESEILVEKTYENLKDELKALQMTDEQLNLLIELLKTGNIVINRKNADTVINLLKFLSQKGIILTVKI